MKIKDYALVSLVLESRSSPGRISEKRPILPPLYHFHLLFLSSPPFSLLSSLCHLSSLWVSSSSAKNLSLATTRVSRLSRHLGCHYHVPLPSPSPIDSNVPFPPLALTMPFLFCLPYCARVARVCPLRRRRRPATNSVCRDDRKLLRRRKRRRQRRRHRRRSMNSYGNLKTFNGLPKEA